MILQTSRSLRNSQNAKDTVTQNAISTPNSRTFASSTDIVPLGVARRRGVLSVNAMKGTGLELEAEGTSPDEGSGDVVADEMLPLGDKPDSGEETGWIVK